MTIRKLAAERRRREAAEAEVIRLRAQLEAVSTSLATARIPSNAVESLTELISQLKRTGQQLEDQQGLARQVIDNSPNLIYVEDEAGRCVLSNKSYLHLQNQRIDLNRLEEKQPGISASQHATEWPSNASSSYEEFYQLKDGQTVWYYTTKSPLVRSDGSRYLLTYSSDITDLKRAYRVAEESVQAKQTFVATMSHEIRTPLHGVMGLAGLLRKGPLSEEQEDYVEMIQSSTENLLVIINDILDYAKIESGTISLESIPFDILKTVQDAARSLSFKIAEKGLLLHIVNLNDKLPQAQGDPFRLHQVLVNLISNAIKFTQQGIITITIDARPEEGGKLPVTFSVADTGIGISPDNLHQIFNSFQQANSSIPRLYGGTGLGLTICKNIVELQGGQIGVRSELGQGSCFYFTVPYQESTGTISHKPATTQPLDLLEGLSVLLAEDNSVNQLIAVTMLGQWQIQVDLAQNGEEAILKAQQRKYDIILMDVQMPQLDGLAATVRLRQEANPNQETPIIALTADAIRISEESYEALGFTDFLTKPYSEAELYNLLAQTSQRQQTPLPAPPPVASQPEGLRYDFYMLGKLASNKEFIRKMLELFIERVPGQVKTLQQAVEQEDWEAVAREAHTLKSTFGSLNIQPETSHLRRLEELAELQAPKHELSPLSNAVCKATQQFVELFAQELIQLS
ncbi:response regulator [Hymenobacter taeanensis]|uniref:histidine kinase n=1 Tax=Hymenobacter taeanensis TaxID=2735321 RepID=A0A6M6BD65_9BACT|nr:MULTISPECIES: ATP-binding protein [Hymenobacter]QJX45939.1 response regulator [Hymenobacter taeanensis]UOQ79786.1 ATP-binding protein [Hymenobacter sp. 5414T-23]